MQRDHRQKIEEPRGGGSEDIHLGTAVAERGNLYSSSSIHRSYSHVPHGLSVLSFEYGRGFLPRITYDQEGARNPSEHDLGTRRSFFFSCRGLYDGDGSSASPLTSIKEHARGSSFTAYPRGVVLFFLCLLAATS